MASGRDQVAQRTMARKIRETVIGVRWNHQVDLDSAAIDPALFKPVEE